MCLYGVKKLVALEDIVVYKVLQKHGNAYYPYMYNPNGISIELLEVTEAGISDLIPISFSDYEKPTPKNRGYFTDVEEVFVSGYHVFTFIDDAIEYCVFSSDTVVQFTIPKGTSYFFGVISDLIKPVSFVAEKLINPVIV
jgi:hypothetical protein